MSEQRDDAELIASMLDGSLPHDQRAALAQRVATDADFRKEIQAQMLMARLTATCLRMEEPSGIVAKVYWLAKNRRQSSRKRHVSQLLRKAHRRRRLRLWLQFTLATAALVIVSLLVLNLQSSQPASAPPAMAIEEPRIQEKSAPPPPAIGQPIAEVLVGNAVTQTLRAKDVIAASPTTNRIRLIRDGSLITLAQGAALTVVAERLLDVKHGFVECEAQPQDPAQPLIISAGRMRCVVVGTRFCVDRDATATTVAVDHGTVRVEGSSPQTILVDSGKRLTASEAGTVRLDVMPPALIDDFTTTAPLQWRAGFSSGSLMTLSRVTGPDGGQALHASASLKVTKRRYDSWAQAQVRTQALDGRGYAGLTLRIRLDGGGALMSLGLREQSEAGEENWRFLFANDIPGWRTITIPWSAFDRDPLFQPSGAVSDGFSPAHITNLFIGSCDETHRNFTFDLGSIGFLTSLPR